MKVKQTSIINYLEVHPDRGEFCKTLDDYNKFHKEVQERLDGYPKAIDFLEQLEDIISGLEAEADNAGINMQEARYWWLNAREFLESVNRGL